MPAGRSRTETAAGEAPGPRDANVALAPSKCQVLRSWRAMMSPVIPTRDATATSTPPTMLISSGSASRSSLTTARLDRGSTVAVSEDGSEPPDVV